MANYLTDQVFNTYFSGVYNGNIIFRKDKAVMCKVDRRTRAQLKEQPLGIRPPGRPSGILTTMVDYAKIYSELEAYTACAWDEARVKLSNGLEYSRHVTYTGQVNGQAVTVQLWAQRKSMGCVDVLTADGKVVGFSNPGRICSEITVLAGYEAASPLVKFDDPLLSRAQYGVNPLGNIFVPCKDGTLLATEVFLPEGETKKVPAIVVRTCYGKERDIDRCWHWVTRGYAFVIQDVRGRSDSDGILEPFQNEREDADDLFNWIAAQPWCDGNIGMWGASYLGYTTTAAATAGNPHLKTAISEVNVGSPFYDTARKGGMVCSWPLLCWTLGQSVSNRVDFDVFGGVSINPYEAVRTRPITDIPEKIIGCKSGPWDLWAQHYHYDDFWRHSDNTAHADNIQIPMLIMSGWFDGDALGVQETWRFLNKHDKPGRRIVLGPWPHGLNAWRDCMDLAFGDNAVDYDFDTRIIRWFDLYLKGIQNGEDKQPRATYYVTGENQWHTSDAWMPTEARLVNLYLDSDGQANSLNGNGRIALTPPEADGQDRYLFDPEFPCGGENDGTDDGLVAPYACNSRQIRGDVLVYDSPVLEKDVAIAGPLYAELYAASSAVDTDFYVRVTDVDEKGTARNVSFGLMRAEFRNGWDKPSLLTPGKVEKYEMEMYFNGMVFKQGHRIRIDISSSELMEAFPNTNTGINPYEDPAPIKATQTVYHGKAYPSHVKLPVLYGL